MSLLTILRYPDPRLHKVARPVAVVDARIRQLVADMLETMYAADGVGLAATQVDVHERVIVIDTSEQRDQPLVLINPELVWRSDERAVNEEGCLSVPTIYDKVERHAASPWPHSTATASPSSAGCRGSDRGVRSARDGSLAGQGVRRVPEPAEARAHPREDAKAQPRGAAGTPARMSRAGAARQGECRRCAAPEVRR